MSIRLLSKEAVEKLQRNPYVESVTQRCIRFTVEFKQLAYDEMHRGKSIRQIFEQAGFEIDVLGAKRLINFRMDIERRAEREDGFLDGRKNNYRHEAESEEIKLEKKIKQLEHQVIYLQQENDFLKKIQEAEKEYREQAVKSKCRRK